MRTIARADGGEHSAIEMSVTATEKACAVLTGFSETRHVTDNGHQARNTTLVPETRHVTDNEKLRDDRTKLSAIRHALRCGDCDRELAADAPVWRLRRRVGTFVHPSSGDVPCYRHLPICATCKDDHTKAAGWEHNPAGWSSSPCLACGRPVHRFARVTYEFCSELCKRTTDHARAKQRRAETPRPTVTCAVCGQSFTPPRRDAVTCSHACRQRAYRARQIARR